MEDKNPIQVSERLFNTIECLAASGPLGLLELSKALSLNKATMHRILASLICMDYVRQDPVSLKYSLTFKICGLANQVLAQNNISDLTRPYIRDLAQKAGETVHLVQLDGTNAIYIDKVEDPRNSVRMTSMVGKSVPLYCSGVGKAILADLTDSEIERIWQQTELRSYTDYTITDFSAFMDTIRQIREKGYATDLEENELGVRCIAVSLRDYSGKSAYAVSISAPRDRMTEERFAELGSIILEAKNQIQHAIGLR